MNVELRKDLVDLFRETGRAHHAAFAATDGADPEWPIWYAEHLQTPIADALGTPFTRSRLIYCVMDADFEQAARAPESDWPEFYADQFVERYARSPAPSEDRLALYHSHSCPFCTLVTSAIDRLGLDVELREIFEEPRYRQQPYLIAQNAVPAFGMRSRLKTQSIPRRGARDRLRPDPGDHRVLRGCAGR